MSKRQCQCILFLIAFAISLAHSSIPHTHPERLDSHTHTSRDPKKRAHHHDNSGTDAHHDHSDHSSKSELPVFSHFSNADFLRSPIYKFSGVEWVLAMEIEAVSEDAFMPTAIRKKPLLPRARSLPSSRFRSAESLRAPPNHFS